MKQGTIITYHGVGECPRSLDPHRLILPVGKFAEQMEFLSRRRTVVPLRSIVEGCVPAGKPAVAITFDDGYRGVLTDAGPILRMYGFPAVCFVPTALIGRPNTAVAIDGATTAFNVMNEEELRQAESDGIVIESHGHTHADLTELDDDALRAELEVSAEGLSRTLGRRPCYLAYPFGTHNPVVREAAARAGFEAAFSNGTPAEGQFACERVTIRREEGSAMFAFKTSGRYLAWRHSTLGVVGRSALHSWVRRRRELVKL